MRAIVIVRRWVVRKNLWSPLLKLENIDNLHYYFSFQKGIRMNNKTYENIYFREDGLLY